MRRHFAAAAENEHDMSSSSHAISRVATTAALAVVSVAAAFFIVSHFAGIRVVSPAPASGIAVVPALAFPDLRGAAQPLSNYRGRPLFVNMWATWCPPCRAEIPDLERLYQTERRTGFTVVGVDQGQDAEPVADFASDYRLTYPIVLDKNQELNARVGAEGLPTTLVYNRAGKLVDVVTGAMTREVMRAELQKAESR